MGRDNSGFTRNEENSHDPKESIEKNNTLEQRRNATFDERNERAVQGPLAMIHTRRHTPKPSQFPKGVAHRMPHLALILSNQASVDENNLTIPFMEMEMILAHHMLTTPIKVEMNFSRTCP
jgi:hypothetical protein